jgi:mono/diheme cytochrome c family protein
MRVGLFLFIAAFLAGIAAPLEAQTQAPRALFDHYCVTCHNQKLKTAGLELDKLDPTRAADNPESWEKVIRKLRAGMMPPLGMPRPDSATIAQTAAYLEDQIDRAAATKTHLTVPAVHRLNRTEYANAVRDLLALEIDPASYLPADDSSYGFDNVASGLGVSPALVEGYVSAAAKIARLALGHETAPSRKIYRVREDYSQEDHVEGLSFGTRGGILIHHYFPADGEYAISWDPVRTTVGALYGGDSPDEQLELTIDGERVKLFKIGTDIPISTTRDKTEVRVPVKAGSHAVGFAFLATTYVPNVDLNHHYQRSILDDNLINGFTFTPQLSSVTISGPSSGARVQGPETPSRHKIFVCRPSSAAEESPCARKILSTLARQAYRRPLTEADTERLLNFYQAGRAQGDFEDGIERGLEFVLAHPEFVFRTETTPANIKPGQPYRINDLELAARLSFFIWSSVPDDQLLRLATQGKLRDPVVLDEQVHRMLADPRAHELALNFAGQWLQLRTLETATPAGTLFPDFDDNLRHAFRTEAEMFFESIVREDRSALDLLNGDYTFVNERLARHYGIPGIYGSQFRRVTLGDEFANRRGLLGKGAILLATSVSDRTSPVQRGKWVLTNILGVVPPDPPPGVPPLKPGATAQATQTMRQRMEEHRQNPACASCHKMMDPIGFTLENFDAVGKWRVRETGAAIDVSGQLTDGTKIQGVAGLRQALEHYSPQFLRTFTEKLLTYALGRGVDYQDMPVVRAIVRDAAPNDYRFSAIALGIVSSAPFQMNMAPNRELVAGKAVPAQHKEQE